MEHRWVGKTQSGLTWCSGKDLYCRVWKINMINIETKILFFFFLFQLSADFVRNVSMMLGVINYNQKLWVFLERVWLCVMICIVLSAWPGCTYNIAGQTTNIYCMYSLSVLSFAEQRTNNNYCINSSSVLPFVCVCVCACAYTCMHACA